MTNSYPFSVLGEEFKDQRVLVTGGTKGIGEANVRRFQLGGALVATTARAPIPHGYLRKIDKSPTHTSSLVAKVAGF